MMLARSYSGMPNGIWVPTAKTHVKSGDRALHETKSLNSPFLNTELDC